MQPANPPSHQLPGLLNTQATRARSEEGRLFSQAKELLASMLSLKPQKGVACCISSHFEESLKNLFSLHESVQWKLQDNSVKKSTVCILPQLWSLCFTLIDIIIRFSKTHLACWHQQALSGRQITWLTRMACLLNKPRRILIILVSLSQRYNNHTRLMW